MTNAVTYMGGTGADPQYLGSSSFALPITYMRVTRRYPTTGRPQSIDVELQTGTNWSYWLRYPFSIVECSNAKVAAVDPASGNVLGTAYVATSKVNCVGTGRIQLDFSGLSRIPDTIQVEAFEDTVDLSKIAQYTPLKTIKVPLNISYQQGLQTGAYSQPNTILSQLGLNINVRSILLTGILAAGGYLAITHRHEIENMIRKVQHG